MPFFHGMAFGAMFVFTLGPTFFAILQSSLSRGFVAGVLTALGISVCDITYASIASMGFADLLNDGRFRWWLALVGGVLLFVFGLLSILKKQEIKELGGKKVAGSFLSFFVKGLLINGINPFVIVFWLGIVGVAAVNWDYQDNERNWFIAGMLVMILASDITKSYLANYLRPKITGRRIQLLNRVVGVALILFSFQMFYVALTT